MKRVLLIDNYDSFTYNLVHIVEKVSDFCVEVYRSDKISMEKMADFDKIIFSPGPGVPSQAGDMIRVIREYASCKSMLGVCLGHQAIAEAFGGSLVNLQEVYHGVATPVKVIKQDSLFHDIPSTFYVGRYHSWVVNRVTLSTEFEITAVDEQDHIMAMVHKSYNLRGVQFHPESVLTEYGEKLIQNWLKE